MFLTSFCFFLCISLISCETEKDFISDGVNNKDYQIKKISFSELKSNQKAFQKLKDVFVKKNPYLQRGVYNEDYGVFIDTTNIVIVENGEKHSITFQIVDEEYSNKLENLVLNSKEDGSYIAYITEYLLTLQELNKLAKGESLPSKSPLAITKIESLSRIIISGNGAGCVSFNTYFIHVCRDKDENLIQDNGDRPNDCAGMSFDYEHTVLTINSSCLEEFSNASSGGSNSSGSNGTNGSNGGMGGGSFGNPNNSNPILTTPVISQNKTEIKILSLLNEEQTNWWWFTATKVIKDGIIAFFNSSGYTDEDNFNFIEDILDDLCPAGNNPTPEYTPENYPGIDDGMPFEWWKDKEYIKANLRMTSDSDINGVAPAPNAIEILLFTIYPSSAILHVRNSNLALDKSQNLVLDGVLTHLHNGKADAYRHAFWNARDTADFGSIVTKLFTDAHEWQSGNHPK